MNEVRRRWAPLARRADFPPGRVLDAPRGDGDVTMVRTRRWLALPLTGRNAIPQGVKRVRP